MILQVSDVAMREMRFTAAESYPLEVSGVLLGEPGAVSVAIPFTKYVARSNWELDAGELRALEEIAELVYPELKIIGGYHSHTRGYTTASHVDKEQMEEDDYEVIVNVWPGKRKTFRFSEKAYHKSFDGKVSRVTIS